MKRLILLLILCAITFTSFTQMCDCPKFKDKQKWGKNELGINLYNITDIKVVYYEFPTFIMGYMNGIMYKRHYNKNAIRIGLGYDYTRFRIAGNPYPNRYHWNEGQNNFGELRLGYESELTMTRLQPYLALDVTLTYGKIKGHYESYGWDGPPSFDYDTRLKEIGIAPAFGLRYHINNKFSLTAEANLSLAYYQQKESRKIYGGPNLLSGLRPYFNPLRIFSLNYSF